MKLSIHSKYGTEWKWRQRQQQQTTIVDKKRKGKKGNRDAIHIDIGPMT